MSLSNEVIIKRLQSIIKALTHIFPSREKYENEFDSIMFQTLEEQLLIPSNGNNVEYICKEVSEHASKVKIIVNNFGDFGPTIWCPIFSKKFLSIVLSKFEDKNSFGPDFADLFTNLNKLNDVFCGGGFSIPLGKIFETLLLTWVQELQNMASEQMKRLFEIQANEKEDNDMSGIPF